MKDALKRLLNKRGDIAIFLNDEVRARLFLATTQLFVPSDGRLWGAHGGTDSELSGTYGYRRGYADTRRFPQSLRRSAGLGRSTRDA